MKKSFHSERLQKLFFCNCQGTLMSFFNKKYVADSKQWILWMKSVLSPSSARPQQLTSLVARACHGLFLQILTRSFHFFFHITYLLGSPCVQLSFSTAETDTWKCTKMRTAHNTHAHLCCPQTLQHSEGICLQHGSKLWCFGLTLRVCLELRGPCSEYWEQVAMNVWKRVWQTELCC